MPLPQGAHALAEETGDLTNSITGQDNLRRKDQMGIILLKTGRPKLLGRTQRRRGGI